MASKERNSKHQTYNFVKAHTNTTPTTLLVSARKRKQEITIQPKPKSFSIIHNDL